MPLVSGTRLGPYEIVSPLGAGGMGEVYRARDTRLDRTVAIKVLPEHLARNPEFRQRFEREARVVSSLNHPHICVLHDIGQQDGVDFIVMEYLDGETLSARLARGPLPLDQLLACATQIADALGRAHRQGVAHRDLKPGNIMLTGPRGNPVAKLLDFGLAKSVAPVSGLASVATMTVEAAVTVAGSIVGTCQYMAPEQVQGADADARSDIFSFGAVLYEMSTGKRAFDGKSPISILSAILEKEPEPIHATQPVTPAELERTINICLAKDPDRRWQSALDLKLQLESIRDTPVREATPPPARSRREIAAWILAALLLVAAVSLWLLRSSPTVPLAPFRASLLPPPGYSFAPYHFAVSPDGKRLAFVAIAADGRNTLWIRALDARGAQQLNDTDNASDPFWAPDSRRVGFFVPGKLKIVDTATGAIQPLADAPRGRGGAWTRDGMILFSPEVGGPVLGVSERGGAPRQVTQVDPQGGKAHRWPLFLPGEKRFLFFQEWGPSNGPHPDGIYAASLDGGEPKLVSPDIAGNVVFASGHLLYGRDVSLMAQPFDHQKLSLTGPAVPVFDQEIDQDIAFSRTNLSLSENIAVFQSLSDAASELIWYTPDGKEAGRVPEFGGQMPALSPNGRFLAVTSDEAHNGRRTIRVHDLQRRVATSLTSGGRESNPVWSPDSKKIVHASVKGSTAALYEISADGSGKPELLVSGARMSTNAWSPDGRYILYMTFEKGPPRLGIYDRAERKSSIWSGAVDRAAEGQISPDGKWLSYTTGDIFVQPFSPVSSGPGARVQISSNGGTESRWSRDGRKLFFIAPDRKLMEVSIEVRGGELVASAPRPLFQTHIIGARFTLQQYDVSPDGRFLVNSLRPEAPLTLVTNWAAALRR